MEGSVRRSLLASETGVVFFEFLISFIPLWVFALCIFQLMLIVRADLVVRHAADAAARSAAVVLPDDPSEYGDEPQMSVARQPRSSAELSAALDAVASVSRSQTFSASALRNLGRSRLNTIRLAAHVPLMPLAPSGIRTRRHTSLENSLGGTRSFVSSLQLLPLAVAVTFPGATGDFVGGPEVTVRVSYAYPCSVPIARRVLCRSFDELPSTDDWRQSFFAVAQRFLVGSFRELQHESTAVIHAAPYSYRPRGT